MGPSGGGRFRGLSGAVRAAAIVVAAVALGGCSLLVLRTALVTEVPGSSLPARGLAAASPSPTPTPTPIDIPPVYAPATPLPPRPDDGSPPDVYLGDITSDRSTNSGYIDGPDYHFVHGYGMSLSRSTREVFMVPARYRSLVASLKGLGATIRFTLYVNGSEPVFDRTISSAQPVLTITCAVPEGATVILAAVYVGGGQLSDAAAVWGDARFSATPAPRAGCSI